MWRTTSPTPMGWMLNPIISCNMATTKKQALNHNRIVIANASAALLESKMVDPYRFLEDTRYAAKMINRYIEAANVTREVMHMPKMFLYDMREFEDEEDI